MRRRSLRLSVSLVAAVVACAACGGSSGAPVHSLKSQACAVTAAFPDSERDPAPLAQSAEQAVRKTGPFPPQDRSLFLALAAVAESARNAAEIQTKVGPAWSTSLSGERVLTQLREDEANLSAACR